MAVCRGLDGSGGASKPEMARKRYVRRHAGLLGAELDYAARPASGSWYTE